MLGIFEHKPGVFSRLVWFQKFTFWQRVVVVVTAVVVLGFIYPHVAMRANSKVFDVPPPIQQAIDGAWYSNYGESGIPARIVWIKVDPSIIGTICPAGQQVEIRESSRHCTQYFYHDTLFQVRIFEYGWWGLHVATRDVFNNESHHWNWWNGFH